MITVYGFEESPFHDIGDLLTTVDSLDTAIDWLNSYQPISNYSHLVFLENGKPIVWRGWLEVSDLPQHYAWLPMLDGELADLQDFALQCGLFLNDGEITSVGGWVT
jgi:hypothetical protein